MYAYVKSVKGRRSSFIYILVFQAHGAMARSLGKVMTNDRVIMPDYFLIDLHDWDPIHHLIIYLLYILDGSRRLPLSLS
jgi:hypothetical protein